MNLDFNYCERTSLEFLAEPLNAFTNIFFIMASIALLYQNKSKSKTLAVIIFLIGISSFLYHSMPIAIWGFLDALFIVLFIFNYLYFLTFNILKKSLIISLATPIIYIYICYFFGNYFKDTFLGNTAFYIPLILILYLYYYLLSNQKELKRAKLLLAASILFTLSSLFRLLDYYLCEILSIGTHFIWHILNALTLYILGKFYYLNSTEPPQKNQPKPK